MTKRGWTDKIGKNDSESEQIYNIKYRSVWENKINMIFDLIEGLT